jgi:NAD(P)-dependent dehydrogenase (short-subunit alcohol dehydrogenase family)
MERSWQGGRVAYTQSKLAQVMFTLDLAEALKAKNVNVTALHPATFMDTGMVRDAGIKPLSTVEQGADAILALAVGAQHPTTTGKFFNGLDEARANAQAYDSGIRKKIAAVTQMLTGL